MHAFIADWLNILIRWFHLVAGIGWIGASFYFIGLDMSLKKRAVMNDGVSGTVWQVHGGGFYHVEKYLVAPAAMPDDLVWFKWEAYLTFLSGFALIVVQYYWNADSFLIDPGVRPLQPSHAILISVASLAAGWFGYDALCRSPAGRSTATLAIMVFAMILIFAWFFTHVFSGRGAFIHVGAFVGTIMTANVFAVIIPNQKKIAASLLKGEAPDPRLGAIGKQRSVHNTYLTLPVLLMMVSNHYPVLTGHPQSWAVVGLVLIMGGAIRHVMVRHEAGDHLSGLKWFVVLAAAGLAGLLWLTAPRPDPRYASVKVEDADIDALRMRHCIMCHSAHPTHEAFREAPKGVMFDTLADMRKHRSMIMQQAVLTETMPLGNQTGMTPDERLLLGAWISRQ